MNGKAKVPPTAADTAMRGEATGSCEATNHHGAGERDRTVDIELGKERAASRRCPGPLDIGTPEGRAHAESVLGKDILEAAERRFFNRHHCQLGGSHPSAASRSECDRLTREETAHGIHKHLCHVEAGAAIADALRAAEPAPPISHLLMARTRTDAELSACAMAVAKAASVYLGTCAAAVEHLDEGNFLDAAVIAGRDSSVRSGVAELTRTVENFRRAEVAHSAALRALVDGAARALRGGR